MKKAASKKQRMTTPAAELAALARKPEADIDLSDAREMLDWSVARRGVFYRPIKQQLTLRLDSDVVAWFKRRAPRGKGYQTDINRALRDFVRQHDRKRRVG